MGTARPPAPALLRSCRLRGEVVNGKYRVEGKVPYDVALVIDRRQRVEDGIFVLAVVVAGLTPSFSSHVTLTDALGEGVGLADVASCRSFSDEPVPAEALVVEVDESELDEHKFPCEM